MHEGARVTALVAWARCHRAWYQPRLVGTDGEFHAPGDETGDGAGSGVPLLEGHRDASLREPPCRLWGEDVTDVTPCRLWGGRRMVVGAVPRFCWVA